MAPHIAKYGAINEAIALTNCPNVSVEAKRAPPPATVAMSGFSDTCMSVLPMPSSENETSITAKLLPTSAKANDSTVTASDSNTVRRRPILVMSKPVGTLKIRNQKNTSDGSVLASESLRPKSAFT